MQDWFFLSFFFLFVCLFVCLLRFSSSPFHRLLPRCTASCPVAPPPAPLHRLLPRCTASCPLHRLLPPAPFFASCPGGVCPPSVPGEGGRDAQAPRAKRPGGAFERAKSCVTILYTQACTRAYTHNARARAHTHTHTRAQRWCIVCGSVYWMHIMCRYVLRGHVGG
jgi:hypothetical protein